MIFLYQPAQHNIDSIQIYTNRGIVDSPGEANQHAGSDALEHVVSEVGDQPRRPFRLIAGAHHVRPPEHKLSKSC